MGDKKGRRSRSASDCRRAQEKWEEAVGKFCQGDLEKRANVEEICSWFPSLQMFIDHGRGLIKVLTAMRRNRCLVLLEEFFQSRFSSGL